MLLGMPCASGRRLICINTWHFCMVKDSRLGRTRSRIYPFLDSSKGRLSTFLRFHAWTPFGCSSKDLLCIWPHSSGYSCLSCGLLLVLYLLAFRSPNYPRVDYFQKVLECAFFDSVLGFLVLFGTWTCSHVVMRRLKLVIYFGPNHFGYV